MTTTQLQPGGNLPLPHGELELTVHSTGGPALDLSAVLVGADGRVRSDDDLVFYNQPQAEGGAVRLAGLTLRLDPARLPADVQRVVVAATLDGGEFAQVAGLALAASGPGGAPVASFPIGRLGRETLLLLGEVYRRDGGWRLRALGQGYDTGLAGLAADFGVAVEEPATPAPASTPVVTNADDRISLRKQQVRVSLEKRGAGGVRARVALVLDRSGSMRERYADGTVGRLVERLVPVAAVLDDDGELDAWTFADHAAALPPVRVRELHAWVERNVYLTSRGRQLPPLRDGRERQPDPLAHIRGGNNEPEAIQQVLDAYAAEPGPPVLVLFFSDGGVNRTKQIQALLTDAARRPLFWQFVGLGRAEYGILERFDTMPGRVVDNAGFFQVDDIDRLDDADLYDRLLAEFPQWLTEARRLGIVPN